MKYNFDMVDTQTVESLSKRDKTLLPYKEVNSKKLSRWNTKKINSQILQGIISGESIFYIAKRLSNVTDMNRNSAKTNARTCVTNAQNNGRIESMIKAKNMGVDIKKQWMATGDARTRISHMYISGEIKDIEKKFSNGLMFPGDNNGAPEEVYNCRCTLSSVIQGIDVMKELSEKDVWNGFEYKEKKETIKKKIKFDYLRDKIIGKGEEIANQTISGIEIKINEVGDEKIKTFYDFCQEKVKRVTHHEKKGAYFSTRENSIFVNLDTLPKGSSIHTPYETFFHEMAHNLDYVKEYGFLSSNYKNGILRDTILNDWKKIQSDYIKSHWEIIFGENYVGNYTDDDIIWVLRRMDKGESTFFKGIANKLKKGEITSDLVIETWGNDFVEYGLEKKKVVDIVNQGIVDSINKEKIPLIEMANVSDAINGITKGKLSLGAGHSKKYWNDDENLPIEFFAEVCDSRCSNKENFNQMKRFFPNSVKIVDEIIDEIEKMIKKE